LDGRLVDLLHEVKFDRTRPSIFAGDLMTKGPKSREVQSATRIHDKAELVEHFEKTVSSLIDPDKGMRVKR